MGTRGVYGFYLNGKFYAIYKHCDSYPEGLGIEILKQILEAIKEGKLEQWKSQLLQVELIDYTEDYPTKEQYEALKKYAADTDPKRAKRDWYWLLRKTQGGIQATLDTGYFENHVDENGLPFSEEYGYILNFDKKTFDFYSDGDLRLECPLSKLKHLEKVLPYMS